MSTIAEQALGFRLGNYGLQHLADLFTDRQLVALDHLLPTSWQKCESNRHSGDASSGSPRCDVLRRRRYWMRAYADAVAVYSGLRVDRCADKWSTLCIWKQRIEK